MKYRKRQEEIQKEYFPKVKLGGVFGNSIYEFVVKDYRVQIDLGPAGFRMGIRCFL